MSFLVPKPIERQIRSKTQSNCSKNVNNSSIFDKIGKLLRRPDPVIEKLDETLFVSTIFQNIQELCRRPALLKTIDEELVEQKESEANESVIETNVYHKKKIERYCDSNDSNSFDIISKSRIFATLVKGRPYQKADHLVNNSSDENNVKTNAKIKTKHKSIGNKRKSPKKQLKCEPKSRKPLLSIDCDITSKISEYSKQYSKPIKRSNNKKKSIKKLVSNNSGVESMDSGNSSYESIASPLSTTFTLGTYSMPATPISSTDSISSGYSLESNSSSVLSQIRMSLNPKFETYRQYIEKCSQIEFQNIKTKRRSKKEELHFKEKVIQWSNKICSGNSTPVHSIEYLATPPGSPQNGNELNLNTNFDELNEMIESLENIETNERFNDQFNQLLGELFTEFPIT